MELIKRIAANESARRRYELLFLTIAALALTLPFIRQAIHIDAHLTIDWARQAFDHPLWHHMIDYDYFGIRYEMFHDTKPRLYSLFIALLIYLKGGVSAPMMHLAMIPFPIIAVFSMYWLSRRFGVNALMAALLLLLAPAFLVNSHLIMTDVPGLSLWLAGLALFIAGADKDRLAYLLLSALPFTAAIFVYYQGLAVLPLALVYLVTHRKVNRNTIMSLSIPVIMFIAFLSAYVSYYSELPNVEYPVFGLPLDLKSIILRIRGVTTLVGGVIIFPLVGVWLFPRSKPSIYATVAVYIASASWVAVLYILGDMPLGTLILLPLFLASGAAIIWAFTSLFLKNFISGIQGKQGGDDLWLATWFVGILFYCAILLPYPSPRFLLPMVPPVIILMMKLLQERWPDDKRFTQAVIWIAAATFVLSMLIAVAEHQRANTNITAAGWVADEFAESPGQVWFNGGLGFQYYMEEKGFRMIMTDSEEPAPGDIIVESVLGGRWPLGPDLGNRVELIQIFDYERSWPIASENIINRNSWIGLIGVVLPYGVSGEYVDRLYVYEVVMTHEEMLRERELEDESYYWFPKRR
jgi:hypothetical protein